jgi:prepilin-type N-terminal cleavage/methylation domain-containing protein
MESHMKIETGTRQIRSGFTLVELLVVITIIGILASLITVAAAGALKRAHQAQIKTELNQLDMAVSTYRDTYNSYPPNCENDSAAASPQLDVNQVFTDLKRHMKQAFPRSKESDDLLRLISGQTATDTANYNRRLENGMSAGEALVFWLSGFSSDVKYPISGEGGPSYVVTSATDRNDPISNRKWIFPFAVSRLKPRDDQGLFPDPATNTDGNRYITYNISLNGQTAQLHRINFWQYVPAKSEQPYIYFDTSRHPAAVKSGSNYIAPYDPPASSTSAIYAIKKLGESSTGDPPIQFANQDKFQILHAGIDDAWGDFSKMTASTVSPPSDPTKYLLFPTGPFTGDVGDTIVNFSDATLEASQK